jgi:hypothetical protein
MAFGGRVPAVTVGTTPTLLCQMQRSCFIANTDAAAIFVGGPDVTVAAGIPVALTSGTLKLDGVGKVFAISAAGTAAAAVKIALQLSDAREVPAARPVQRPPGLPGAG